MRPTKHSCWNSIDRWVERELKPIVKEYDHADRYPTHIVEQMKELGLFGATIGAEYGGLGLPARTYALIVMRIAAVWMAVTGIFNSHLMLALAVEKFGTPAQKRHWLPRFASGEVRGGLALTEPDAGTDLQAIRTTARRDGDHYVINGEKTWISNGIEGNCVALLVKTDPHAQPRHRGMSLFIAPKQHGIPRRPQAGEARLPLHRFRRAGLRGLPHSGRSPDRRRRGPGLLPGDRRAGTRPHQCRRARRRHRRGRAACWPTEYAQIRKTFGKPIAEHQAIQLKLGEMATRARAARLLTLDAAAAFDRGERCDMEAGMAKYFASEAALENATESMRIHGAYGYSTEFDIERLYRDAPLTCIGEGTNEMQRIIIARHLIKRHPTG